ncbi:MAG: hypothetical protein K2X81_04180, partial [Candidatus Obscuribacterales bacterium]|nr:hypothetical protein [Candidatus Obscuribacterales bacterium]
MSHTFESNHDVVAVNDGDTQSQHSKQALLAEAFRPAAAEAEPSSKAEAPQPLDKATASAKTESSQSLEEILNGLTAPPTHTKVFADSYGRVTHLALMMSPYVSGDDRTQMLGAYKTLFTEMEPDTKFTIAVQTDKDQADIEKVISDNHVVDPSRINFLKPNVGDLTVWARDMMVGMYTPDDPSHTALMHQTTLHSWHLNDMQVPGKIAASNPKILLDTEPFIVTDGGDVQSNTKEAFAGYYSIVSSEMKIAEALDKDQALKAKVFDYYQQHYGKQIVEPAAGDLHFPYIKHMNPENDGSYQLLRDPAFHRDDLG